MAHSIMHGTGGIAILLSLVQGQTDFQVGPKKSSTLLPVLWVCRFASTDVGSAQLCVHQRALRFYPMAHSSFSLCHCRTPSMPLTVLITFVSQLSARLENF